MTKQAEVSQAFDTLIAKYKELLKQCYDALADDADPQQRATLREALGQFIQE